MIKDLKKIESGALLSLLENQKFWKTVDINYHPPKVERLYTDFGDYRISLHLIHPCNSSESLYHPHPWPSAVHIINGNYEMGIGYGPEDKLVKEICKTIMGPGDYYEMLNPDGWHYVRPINDVAWTIMISGKPWNRWSPKSEEKLNPLSQERRDYILSTFLQTYQFVAQ